MTSTDKAEPVIARSTMLRRACFAGICLVLMQPLAGQDAADEDLHSPVAYEREVAAAARPSAELVDRYREVLDAEEANTTQRIRALTHLGTEKQNVDIARIVRFAADLDPSVASAAMEALKSFGREALTAVRALPEGRLDSVTRGEIVNELLKDHVRSCGERDRAVNPLQLSYKGRFDELFSVDADLDSLLLDLLRDNITDIRDDIDGNRSGRRDASDFTEYGALTIAALAERQPDRLMEEVSDLADADGSNHYYYYGYNRRSPVSLALAVFFARQGKPKLVDRFINELESGMRWNNSDELRIQTAIAALQVTAHDEYDAALNRLTENIKTSGTALSPMVTQASYLRARILMHIGEEGSALHALEESAEASDSPVLLTLVDDAFDDLRDVRGFQTVLEYCRLAARRVDEGRRPYGLDNED